MPFGKSRCVYRHFPYCNSPLSFGQRLTTAARPSSKSPVVYGIGIATISISFTCATSRRILPATDRRTQCGRKSSITRHAAFCATLKEYFFGLLNTEFGAGCIDCIVDCRSADGPVCSVNANGVALSGLV